MEQTLMKVFQQGLTWPLMLSLLKIAMIFLILTSFKEWITGKVKRKAAHLRLKKNNFLKKGAFLSRPTPTGSLHWEVYDIFPNKVVLRNEEKDLWDHIPIIQFASQPITFVGVAPTGSAR